VTDTTNAFTSIQASSAIRLLLSIRANRSITIANSIILARINGIRALRMSRPNKKIKTMSQKRTKRNDNTKNEKRD